MSRSYTVVSSFLFLLLLSEHTRHVSSQSYFWLNKTDNNGCGIGEEFRNGSCALCRPGSYRFLGPKNAPTRDPRKCRIRPPTYEEIFFSQIEPSTTRCMSCPAGTFTPYFGANTYDRCRACPVGMTSGEGAARCTECAPGKSSASGSSRCVACPKGFFLTKPCAKGHKPDTACTVCPLGTYASEKNSVDCAKCPSGTSTAKVGATSKEMCKTCGTMGVRCSCREEDEPWSEVGSFRPIGQAICTRCPPGTRAKTPFATSEKECIPCPNGSSYSPMSGCGVCGGVYKTFGRGATQCRIKREDKCMYSFKDETGVCKECYAGFRKVGLKCVRCPPGTVNHGKNSKCRRCNFPEIAPPDGDRFCQCMPNYFRDYNKRTCVPCPKGTKVDEPYHRYNRCEPDCENFPNQPACQPCKEDYERVLKTQECRKCGKGTRALDEEQGCVNPRTGCRRNELLVVTYDRFGPIVICQKRGLVYAGNAVDYDS